MSRDAIGNVVNLRGILKRVFGEGSFTETWERSGYSNTRKASVIDTEWAQEGDCLVAYHWTADAEPVAEKFHFPPTWSNKESWESTFYSDYPECAADAMDIVLWTARTPSRIVIEDANGIRVIQSVATDPVTRVPERKLAPRPVAKPKPKKKKSDPTPTFFGRQDAV